jgi:hypothetical protein
MDGLTPPYRLDGDNRTLTDRLLNRRDTPRFYVIKS